MSSFDWQDYWASRRTLAEKSVEGALAQVGKTIMGKPIPADQLDIIVGHVASVLELSPNDHALDLGCGNGLVTSQLARYVASVTGLDYSENLLRTAREHFCAPGTCYRFANLQNLETIDLDGMVATKAWSIEVVQNLDPESLTRLLRWLSHVMSPVFSFLASGIPNGEQIRAFYDTDERWEQHIRNERLGREQMGRWWHQEELADCAEAAGIKVSFLGLPGELYTAHYRMDALFERMQQ